MVLSDARQRVRWRGTAYRTIYDGQEAKTEILGLRGLETQSPSQRSDRASIADPIARVILAALDE